MLLKNSRGFPVSAACQGEICRICFNFGQKNEIPATHKVEEAFLFDDPRKDQPCHNVTAYVCCYHYRMIFSLKDCYHQQSEDR